MRGRGMDYIPGLGEEVVKEMKEWKKYKGMYLSSNSQVSRP